jgi:methyl-accepting chemotaxis protein
MTTEQTGIATLDLQNLLRVLRALRDGDLSQRMPAGQSGVAGEIAETINTTFDRLNAVISELTRIAREVSTEGKLGGQAHVKEVTGSWRELTDDVNAMAWTLMLQIRNMAEVIDAFSQGNTALKVTVDARGEMSQVKDLVNALGDRLLSRSSP